MHRFHCMVRSRARTGLSDRRRLMQSLFLHSVLGCGVSSLPRWTALGQRDWCNGWWQFPNRETEEARDSGQGDTGIMQLLRHSSWIQNVKEADSPSPSMCTSIVPLCYISRSGLPPHPYLPSCFMFLFLALHWAVKLVDCCTLSGSLSISCWVLFCCDCSPLPWSSHSLCLTVCIHSFGDGGGSYLPLHCTNLATFCIAVDIVTLA